MRRLYEMLLDIWGRARNIFRSPYYGFISGHYYLSPHEKQRIQQMVGVSDESVVANFERQFAELVGSGEAVSFASARMGFYQLMCILGITQGHEVILLGSTCSVMANAVMRTGATPVYSDIDPNTFGSSCNAIANCISPNTRMIVAQHSFGIPCDIKQIVELAKRKKIFLLEDCALTLGSMVNGVKVGNFGDAAIFSTDHTKPINTLLGGLIYTNNNMLAVQIRLSNRGCQELSPARQHALWRRLLLEAKYCNPDRYGYMGLIDLFFKAKEKIIRSEGDFLVDDCGVAMATSYPYPAKMPTFLAAIGIIETNRWRQVSAERIGNLKKIIETFSQSCSSSYLPAAYSNESLEIVPLRFVWSDPNGENIRSKLSSFLHVPWTWFMKPIISTRESLDMLGYRSGACPISEGVGPNMVNIPCIHSEIDTVKIISLIKDSKL
jgi:perosamine synthetase